MSGNAEGGRKTTSGVRRALLGLPLAVVAGGVLGALVSYAPSSEDLEAPSSLVTVMGLWEGAGEPLCRPFHYRDLLPRMDTLDIRLYLEPSDTARCRADFTAYDPAAGWPRRLTETERGYAAYSFEIEEGDPVEVTVHRSSGDANFARTHYRVDASGRITDLRTESASAGQGLGVVAGAMLGIVLWLLWSSSLAVRAMAAAARRRRR